MSLWRSVALAALLVTGCPSRDAGSSAAPQNPEVASARTARAGVKVPLPDGWTARVASDQSFRAGPQDRVVLRIDQRPGAARELPTADELQAGLSSALPGAKVSRTSANVDEELVVLRLRILGARDGGEKNLPVVLGAKRIGEDLFLCATEPGATDDEVEKAAAACAHLSLAPANP